MKLYILNEFKKKIGFRIICAHVNHNKRKESEQEKIDLENYCKSNDIIFEYPEYYPNFNKMASEGWNYVNNYSPRNGCATLKTKKKLVMLLPTMYQIIIMKT